MGRKAYAMGGDIERRVIQIIIEMVMYVKPDEVVPSARFVNDLKIMQGTVEWEELIIELETELCISISGEEESRLKTVGDAIDLVKSKVLVGKEKAQ